MPISQRNFRIRSGRLAPPGCARSAPPLPGARMSPARASSRVPSAAAVTHNRMTLPASRAQGEGFVAVRSVRCYLVDEFLDRHARRPRRRRYGGDGGRQRDRRPAARRPDAMRGIFVPLSSPTRWPPQRSGANRDPAAAAASIDWCAGQDAEVAIVRTPPPKRASTAACRRIRGRRTGRPLSRDVGRARIGSSSSITYHCPGASDG